MTRHIIGSLVVLVSILVFPYWVYMPILFIAIVIIPFFWEGILLALLIHVIHGNGAGILLSLVSPLVLSVLIVLIILLPIRENLRSHV